MPLARAVADNDFDLDDSPNLPPKRPNITWKMLLTNPASARDLIKKHRFPGQRKIRLWQVEFIKNLLRAKHFMQGTTITFAQYGNHKFLINGNHTLIALGEMPKGAVWLTFQTIVVEDYAEVGELYRKFDRALVRSWRDLYQADPALRHDNLAEKHLNLLGPTTVHLANGFKQHVGFGTRMQHYNVVKDDQVRFRLMASFTPEMAEYVGSVHGDKHNKHLVEKGPVLSVMLVTYRHCLHQAKQFWPRVVADNGLKVAEPEHTLLNWLRNNPLKGMDTALYARYVAGAWNNAYTGKSVRTLNPRAASEPICILGTPYTGDDVRGYVTTGGQIVKEPVILEGEQAGQRA